VLACTGDPELAEGGFLTTPATRVRPAESSDHSNPASGPVPGTAIKNILSVLCIAMCTSVCLAEEPREGGGAANSIASLSGSALQVVETALTGFHQHERDTFSLLAVEGGPNEQ